ncbi:DUF305 domain-containing protein [Streptomyces sp. NPDC051287]|uniref:DUF305 domain-containing protein n=1 Tax=Streptomyces sp. NPDC051287 TaxID=3365648 RepID=UPI0037918130
MTTTRTRAALGALAAIAALALTACGGGDGAAAPHGGGAADTHNAQDVTFAQRMIPHHRQALEMAELAAGRASSPRVKDLAARIEKAQDPEIGTMSGWLKAWGEDVPMAGMNHGGHSGTAGAMTGMMDDADMTALKKAEGPDFDTKFLTMMAEHHRGAVEMAATERSAGAYRPATALARAIATGQNAEIKEMNRLLGKG